MYSLVNPSKGQLLYKGHFSYPQRTLPISPNVFDIDTLVYNEHNYKHGYQPIYTRAPSLHVHVHVFDTTCTITVQQHDCVCVNLCLFLDGVESTMFVC